MKASNLPAWLSQFEQATPAWQAFLRAELPTNQQERFKYTDFSFLTKQTFSPAKKVEITKEQIASFRIHPNNILLVVVDGFFRPELSDRQALSNDAVSHLDEAGKLLPENPSAFILMNQALSTDGLFLKIPNNVQIDVPIQILSLTTQAGIITTPNYYFHLGENAQVEIVDTYHSLTASSSFANIVVQIQLEKNVNFCYTKVQAENNQGIHLAHLFLQQAANSQASLVNITTGGIFSRDEVTIDLNEPGANCQTSSFYQLTQDKQYVDHHVDINHHARHSQSDMLYKGILQQASRAVFNGRLHVTPAAQQITAQQTNHHLLLSPQAESYSKPELEIYADDVKCKHGATTGQIDQEALFYLRARGIPYTEAYNLLIAGFAEEVLQRVTNLDVRTYLRRQLAWQP